MLNTLLLSEIEKKTGKAMFTQEIIILKNNDATKKLS